MDTKYVQKIKVLSSRTDFKMQVGFLEAACYFQDNMCEYYKSLNCDGVSLIESSNVFWALTKSKMKFHSPIKWLDDITMSTDIYKLASVRINLFNEIKSDGGGLECIQELCAMDYVTRRPRNISTINEWPTDVELKENTTGLEFVKMDFEKDDKWKCDEITVNACDVDYFGHTNNISYLRFVMGTLGSEFLKSIDYDSFEIHYIRECKCGMKLKIYSMIENDKVLFQINDINDCVINKCVLSYFNKN